MLDIRRILCPTDFSDTSNHAAAHAEALALWYGASISALHVYNPILLPIPGLGLAGYRGEPEPDERMKADFRERLQSTFPQSRAGRIRLDTRIEVGPPAIRIVAAATALPADIIAMGTHGASGLEHLVLGSVTEHVLRHAPCPVLTVPPRSRATSVLPFKRLLVPVDFSDWSLAAVEAAWSLAKESEARVTLLCAMAWGPEGEMGMPLPDEVPVGGHPREQDIEARLWGLVPDGVRDWCMPSVRVERGRPFREILRVADEVHADLIVMGVHGRSALGLALFGSTTNQVVRRATCPVLTLRR
jgi:nucleotide-binding universal stress UspA family protein